eukprot:3013646-Prymnesium_polylepis.1
MPRQCSASWRTPRSEACVCALSTFLGSCCQSPELLSAARLSEILSDRSGPVREGPSATVLRDLRLFGVLSCSSAAHPSATVVYNKLMSAVKRVARRHVSADAALDFARAHPDLVCPCPDAFVSACRRVLPPLLAPWAMSDRPQLPRPTSDSFANYAVLLNQPSPVAVRSSPHHYFRSRGSRSEPCTRCPSLGGEPEHARAGGDLLCVSFARVSS